MSLGKKVGVIGAGSWGTALATVAVNAGFETTIWARSSDISEAINTSQQNPVYLPGITLPETLTATTNKHDLDSADLVLIATPAQALRTIMAEFAPLLRNDIPGIICAKGIEQKTDQFMADVLRETCPNMHPAILSGPSFAADVTRGLPTAVTLAAEDMQLAKSIAPALSLSTFRIYPSDDMMGVQLGGAVKNVLALACGMADGKNFGDSARAALTTRGFAEMCRMGTVLGAKMSTLTGLSGLGDLILTCSSTQSRNFSLGRLLGEGKSLADIMAGRRSVSEGVHSAGVVVEIARQHNIDMPIAEAVFAVVGGASSLDKEISRLLARPVRSE